MNYYYYIYFFIFCIASSSAHADVYSNWTDMRNQYLNLSKELINLSQREKEYCGHFWAPRKDAFKQIILGQLNPNLWKINPIFETMVRSGFGDAQEFEVCFLQTCLSKQSSDRIKSYVDTNFNGMPLDCREFNCSTNTLGHLFYVGKILETAKSQKLNIDSVVEFGAGYGNLSRILKTLLPATTIINIDLPEFLAIQYFFLKSTSPQLQITLHTFVPDKFEKNQIHLVPVHFLPDLNINADLFISTFGLTEAPNITQKLVADKRFFNAKLTYVTGQLYGWGTAFKLEDHNILHNAIRSVYSGVQCHPFHIFFKHLKSYEMIAY